MVGCHVPKMSSLWSIPLRGRDVGDEDMRRDRPEMFSY